MTTVPVVYVVTAAMYDEPWTNAIACLTIEAALAYVSGRLKESALTQGAMIQYCIDTVELRQ